MTWAESLPANYTDGIVVLHQGRIVYERYFGALTAAWPARGVFGDQVVHRPARRDSGCTKACIDEKALVAKYVPELEGSAFGDATVRQLLDMTTGIKFPRTTPTPRPRSGATRVPATCCRARPATRGRRTFYDFLQTVKKEGGHGEASPTRPSTPTPGLDDPPRQRQVEPARLLQDRIWSKLGMEQDAYLQRRQHRAPSSPAAD